MFAVIFRARINRLDSNYNQTAARMRDLAINHYGCLDFISLSNNEEEVAISYWPDEAAIQAWKKDPEHREAQKLGRSYWYSAYSVEVVEVQRRYCFDGSNIG